MAETPVTRRSVLLWGGGALGLVAVGGAYELVQHDVLPGRIRLNDVLGAGGDPPTTPDIEPGSMVTGSFTSAARAGTKVGWSIAYPPGATTSAQIPVCVAMHGRGASNTWMFDSLSLQYFLADAVMRHDVPPFAIASIDGGESTYWHPRSNGDDPSGMVTDEYLPQLVERGLLVDRLGLWGWSMGGYGALLLASSLGPKRVSAVVASSPALSRTPGETAPGAFDDPADFERNNIFSREADLKGIPLRIDIGHNDSFTPAVEQFRDELATTPDGGVTSGSHDSAYWMRVAPAEIEFLGTHLAT